MSCRKASYIIEKKGVTKISFWEKLFLKLHLMVCKLCRKYQSDSFILGKLLKKLAAHDHEARLTAEEKIEIKKRLSST